jgi:hypothetical protein
MRFQKILDQKLMRNVNKEQVDEIPEKISRKFFMKDKEFEAGDAVIRCAPSYSFVYVIVCDSNVGLHQILIAPNYINIVHHKITAFTNISSAFEKHEQQRW